eukprot:3463716-Lingulodinium_polyedra.AAC.1
MRGFDTEAISNHCQDKYEHPVLGMCYRVSIRVAFKGTCEAMIREELHQAKAQKMGTSGIPLTTPGHAQGSGTP